MILNNRQTGNQAGNQAGGQGQEGEAAQGAEGAPAGPLGQASSSDTFLMNGTVGQGRSKRTQVSLAAGFRKAAGGFVLRKGREMPAKAASEVQAADLRGGAPVGAAEERRRRERRLGGHRWRAGRSFSASRAEETGRTGSGRGAPPLGVTALYGACSA